MNIFTITLRPDTVGCSHTELHFNGFYFRYDQETGGVLYTWGSGRGGALGFRSEEDVEDPTVVGDLQDMQVNGLKRTIQFAIGIYSRS